MGLYQRHFSENFPKISQKLIRRPIFQDSCEQTCTCRNGVAIKNRGVKIILSFPHSLKYASPLALRHVSVLGIFLVRIFPHSDLIRSDKEYLSVFSPNAAKHGPEKTSNTDTYHAV